MKITIKERKTSSKIEALKTMRKIAYKYYPALQGLIWDELDREYRRINLENIRRNRIAIIGR